MADLTWEQAVKESTEEIVEFLDQRNTFSEEDVEDATSSMTSDYIAEARRGDIFVLLEELGVTASDLTEWGGNDPIVSTIEFYLSAKLNEAVHGHVIEALNADDFVVGRRPKKTRRDRI